jgi:hypothetical protein
MPLAIGDVARLRLVATVTAIDATTITVMSSGGNPVVFPKAINNDPGFAYEIIPSPEPAYIAGDLYRDAGGSVFQRVATDQPGDRWRVVVSKTRPLGQYVGELVPVRPLTHLIPEPP